MSSYLSNILTNTTSKYNTLRRNLLSDEVDGDTEDDSHLCRALRAYYTEQQKPFPQWLPNDPKRSISSTQGATTTSFTSSLRTPTLGQLQQDQQQQQQQQQQYPSSRPQAQARGTLSDLWDPAPARAASPQPMSLRRQAGDRTASSQGRGEAGGLQAPRPLPSQRAGSYQSSSGVIGGEMGASSPPPLTPSGGTAQERLKARLWGSARSTSPAPGGSGSGPGAGAGVGAAGGGMTGERGRFARTGR